MPAHVNGLVAGLGACSRGEASGNSANSSQFQAALIICAQLLIPVSAGIKSNHANSPKGLFLCRQKA
jgi:hypothetical protein